jgi:hypothetical protein
MKITSLDIEIATAKHFGWRQNVIVPNVHWGLGLNYEADLVVLRPSGWAIEIEIKCSAADIRADLKKRRQHDSPLFRELYFAVPDFLAENASIPAHAGILSIYEYKPGWMKATKTRDPVVRKTAHKWRPETRQKLYELAAMRTWSLKQHLQGKIRRER